MQIHWDMEDRTLWTHGLPMTVNSLLFHLQVATELYDLTNDTGRDFDFDGYSTNLAMDGTYASEVAALLAALRAEVQTWY
jgi:hypothetical protein